MNYNYPALPEFVCKQNLFVDLIIIGIGAAIAGPVGFFLAYFYVGSCHSKVHHLTEMRENEALANRDWEISCKGGTQIFDEPLGFEANWEEKLNAFVFRTAHRRLCSL